MAVNEDNNPQKFLEVHSQQTYEDLINRKLRVFHPGSFSEDPSRAIRALRYQTQLDLSFADETKHLLADFIATYQPDKISAYRLLQELKRCFSSQFAFANYQALVTSNLADKIFIPTNLQEQELAEIKAGLQNKAGKANFVALLSEYFSDRSLNQRFYRILFLTDAKSIIAKAADSQRGSKIFLQLIWK